MHLRRRVDSGQLQLFQEARPSQAVLMRADTPRSR
jgi:hypothetical protein